MTSSSAFSSAAHGGFNIYFFSRLYHSILRSRRLRLRNNWQCLETIKHEETDIHAHVAGGGGGASLVIQTVKNLPAMWETQVRFLGGEDPLEKGMAIHTSILAWTIPWTEDPGGLQSMGSQRVGHD